MFRHGRPVLRCVTELMSLSKAKRGVMIVPQRSNNGMALLHREGETETWGNAAWQHPWLIRNIMCPDGRRRTAYLGPDANTFFSWPARVKMFDRWVRGFVSGPSAYLDETEPKFTAKHTPENAEQLRSVLAARTIGDATMTTLPTSSDLEMWPYVNDDRENVKAAYDTLAARYAESE